MNFIKNYVTKKIILYSLIFVCGFFFSNFFPFTLQQAPPPKEEEEEEEEEKEEEEEEENWGGKGVSCTLR